MAAGSRRPRVGFLGVGWIGRHRLEAMQATGAVTIAAVADPSAEMARAVVAAAPGAVRAEGLEGLLALGLDAVVIATPSALHADQAVAALDAGVAVFCQKPLGRTAAEVRAAVAAARRADVLLAVDLSYRFTTGARRMRDLVQGGALGRVFAFDLVFHNAYGPDKPWFYDPALSGGGCVMDLGVHLADLALWTLGSAEVSGVESRLYAAGEPLGGRTDRVEDYALAGFQAAGAAVRLACSWRLNAGVEAVIEARVYGTEGGAMLRNVGGSFHALVAERFRGTATKPLAAVEDDWGGRAAADFAQRLAAGARFDAEAERLADVAMTLDAIYGR